MNHHKSGTVVRGRALPAALGLALGLGLVAGCGDQTDAYCDELADQQQTLADLAAEAGSAGEDPFARSLEVFGELRDAAPGDVADEWDTLYFAWEGLAEAFDRAGTTPSEYDPANPPEGVDPAEAEALEDAAAELRSQRVIEAGNGIETHAKDVCGIDLST